MAYNTPLITNALGKPVVEQKQEFFVVFEGVNGTEPEVVDKSSYKITYIVDSQGNISKPAEGAASSFNILQNFNSGEPVTVILDQATSENSTLGGNHTISAIGKPVPYIYSQNGIGSESFESRLVFRPQGAPPSGSYSPLDKYNGVWTSNSVFASDYASAFTGQNGVPPFFGQYVVGNPPYQNTFNHEINAVSGYFRATGYPDWDNLYDFPNNTGVFQPSFSNAGFLQPFGVTQDEFVITWAIPNADQFHLMSPPPIGGSGFDSQSRFTVTNTPESGIASITASDGFYTVDVKNPALQSIDLTVYLKGKTKKRYPEGSNVEFFYPNEFVYGQGPLCALFWQTATSGSTNFDSDYATYTFDSIQLGGLLSFVPYSNIVQTWNNTGFIEAVPYQYYVDAFAFPLDFEATWRVTIPASKIVEGRAIRILIGGNLRGAQTGDSLTLETMNVTFGNQIPQPADYYVENDIYWERNGSSTRVIRSTLRLAEFYDQFYLPTRAQEEFGFDKVSTTFNIKVGDKIRFQYNPRQEFTIYKVITPAEGGGRIKLTLDRDIPVQLDDNMSNFVIYRVDDSLANNIILDVKKTNVLGDPENPFTGIILPQFPSDGIVANSDKILEQLKADGIIKS